MSQAHDRSGSGLFEPRPVHLRLAYAYESCFQDGVSPTDGVIAKRLNVRRETVNRWRRLNPPLWAWLRAQVSHTIEELRPFVDRRIAQLALQGSPEHAKLYYQFIAKLEIPMGDGVPSAPIVHMNFLIPRPEPVVLSTLTARTAMSESGPKDRGHSSTSQTSRPPSPASRVRDAPDIPRIPVRR
jgi:hypothetical protein